MTNEMKLLKLVKAYIEAAGYEIEEIANTSIVGDNSAFKVTKKAKRPRKAKVEAYTYEFERCWHFWVNVMKRPNNNKQMAFKAYQQRMIEGVNSSYLYERTAAYAEFCSATDKVGKETILQAATFYGPSKRYNDDFTPPKQAPEWSKLPRDNEALVPFAKKHGLSKPGAGEFFPQYRKRLELEIENRLSNGQN